MDKNKKNTTGTGKVFGKEIGQHKDKTYPKSALSSAASDISKWQTLKNRLQSGTLLKSLKPMMGSTYESDSGINIGLRGNKYGSNPGAKFNAKMLILEAKSRNDALKKKQQQRAERRKLLKQQKKIEYQLEYLNFPTIMGWYFDGFFTGHFQLNAQYAAIFNEAEQVIAQKKEQAYKETFTEMARRNFWPPTIIAGTFFRTRGVYLDFKEVLKDPPHTPPEITTDPNTKAVTLFLTEGYNEDGSKVASSESIAHGKMTESEFDELGNKARLLGGPSGPSFRDRYEEEMRWKQTHKHAFYFDDSIPGWFRKVNSQRHRYYFDEQFQVWRIKRTPVRFASDYYFDDTLGRFLPKDRMKPAEDYMYYPLDGCYREAGEIGPLNWRGLEPRHFYWDENKSRWNRIKAAPKNAPIVFDDNANRYCIKKPNSRTPDDYYFDTTTLKFDLKKPGRGKDYTYYPYLGAWRRNKDPEPPKGFPTTLSHDYYWNEIKYSFLKKDAPSSFFVYDPNQHFYRKKKSVRGQYHPKNWTWNDKAKVWELKKSEMSAVLSESLNWFPDRDYEKPWLEYAEEYAKFGLNDKDKRQSLEDYDDEPQDKQKNSRLPSRGGRTQGKTGVAAVPPPNKPPPAHTVKGTVSEPVTPYSIMRTESGKDIANKRDSSDEDKLPPVSDKLTEALELNDLFDTKVLKITNLGAVVTDSDVKAYFASEYKIVRPKIPGSSLTPEYAYLFFHTDEAATAALQVMDGKVIKGQTIHLDYKMKEEDPEKGENSKFSRKSKMKLKLKVKI